MAGLGLMVGLGSDRHVLVRRKPGLRSRTSLRGAATGWDEMGDGDGMGWDENKMGQMHSTRTKHRGSRETSEGGSAPGYEGGLRQSCRRRRSIYEMLRTTSTPRPRPRPHVRLLRVPVSVRAG